MLRMRRVSGPLLTITTFHNIHFDSGQWRPWSECADSQADLGRRCPHIPEDIRTLWHEIVYSKALSGWSFGLGIGLIFISLNYLEYIISSYPYQNGSKFISSEIVQANGVIWPFTTVIEKQQQQQKVSKSRKRYQLLSMSQYLDWLTSDIWIGIQMICI